MRHLALYVKFLQSFLKPKISIKVVFDCSNGTTGLVIKPLLKKRSKIEAILINAKPDGHFPAHSPNPLDKGAKTKLINKVIKEKADLGVIFDGDGDRALFVDNLGKNVPPDAMARLLISYLKPKSVVLDTITGFLVKDKKVFSQSFRIFDSRVGGYFLEKTMRRKRAELGVEKSGHYYFKKFYYWDSGILSAILILNFVSILKKEGGTLADWLKALPKYYSLPELNLKVRSPEEAMKFLKKIFPKRGGRLSFRDGLTLGQKDFWLNVRASETQPLVRVNLEARSKKVFVREKHKLISLLKEAGFGPTIHT